MDRHTLAFSNGELEFGEQRAKMAHTSARGMVRRQFTMQGASLALLARKITLL